MTQDSPTPDQINEFLSFKANIEKTIIEVLVDKVPGQLRALSADALTSVFGFVMESAESTLQELEKEYPPSPHPDDLQIACKKGCAACCHQHVTVLGLEAFAIKIVLERTLPPEALASIRQRVHRHAEAIRGTTFRRRLVNQTPCPFLDENKACSIYAARPLACRGTNSYDAQKCNEFDGVSTIPKWWAQLSVYQSVIIGLSKVLEKVKLDGRPLELALALDLLWSDPEAVGRWLAGDLQVLAPAQMSKAQNPRAGLAPAVSLPVLPG